VVLALPAAGAVAVFGTVYGAAARGFLGVPLTLASSLLVYSGPLQFALVALLGAGATATPLLLTAAILNLRQSGPGSRPAAALGERGATPIFASLATATLLGDGGALVGGPTLGAAAGALLASPARSLLICLIAGTGAYALGAGLGWG
jgi:hypothetical protein